MSDEPILKVMDVAVWVLLVAISLGAVAAPWQPAFIAINTFGSVIVGTILVLGWSVFIYLWRR